MPKRTFDIIFSLLLLGFTTVPIIIIFLLIKTTSKGPAIYLSQRIGIDNRIFIMPKFRTMDINTPQVATHLLSNSEISLTPIGSFLRKSSLDELPQLFSILVGHMSFVGPRPALISQEDLISLRTQAGVHKIIPGLTGLAQISGRDELSITKKVELDTFYLKNGSLIFDIEILLITFFKVAGRKGVHH